MAWMAFFRQDCAQTGPGNPNQSAFDPRVMRTGSETDVSPAFQAYVKNTWTNKSTALSRRGAKLRNGNTCVRLDKGFCQTEVL